MRTNELRQVLQANYVDITPRLYGGLLIRVLDLDYAEYGFDKNGNLEYVKGETTMTRIRDIREMVKEIHFDVSNVEYSCVKGANFTPPKEIVLPFKEACKFDLDTIREMIEEITEVDYPDYVEFEVIDFEVNILWLK